MNVKGLTIDDIMNMGWDELNKLNTREMKQITSRLVSASNKRIRRLEKVPMGKSSLAYQTVERRGRNFSVKGKDINQVRNEFKMARSFLKMKTSTATGWKQYQKDVASRMKSSTGIDVSKWSGDLQSKMWKVYRKFEESYGGTFRKGDSDRIQKMLVEMLDDTETMTEDELMNKIEDKYIDLYEEDQMDDILPDDYFDIDM